MNKETSSRVSSIASTILSCEPTTAPATPEEYNSLLAIAKTLAGSALSQDETPGQEELASRASDVRNFQILIHSTVHGGSFGFQWSNRAYNVSIPHEASPADVVRALAQLGVLITRHELENDNG